MTGPEISIETRQKNSPPGSFLLECKHCRELFEFSPTTNFKTAALTVGRHVLEMRRKGDARHGAKARTGLKNIKCRECGRGKRRRPGSKFCSDRCRFKSNGRRHHRKTAALKSMKPGIPPPPVLSVAMTGIKAAPLMPWNDPKIEMRADEIRQRLAMRRMLLQKMVDRIIALEGLANIDLTTVWPSIDLTVDLT